MKQQQKGVRSTKQRIETSLDMIETQQCMNPPIEKKKLNQLFMTMCIIDKKDGTMYANLTGRFPITSMDGKQAMFIMYDWTTNAILATTIKYAKAETIVECFKQQIEYLAKRGFKPVYNVIDNVATNAIKTYLKREDIKVQFVAPYDH